MPSPRPHQKHGRTFAIGCTLLAWAPCPQLSMSWRLTAEAASRWNGAFEHRACAGDEYVGMKHLVPEPGRGPIEMAEAPESFDVRPMSRPENRSVGGAAADGAAAEAVGRADAEAAGGAAARPGPCREGPAPTFRPLKMSPPISRPAWRQCAVSVKRAHPCMKHIMPPSVLVRAAKRMQLGVRNKNELLELGHDLLLQTDRICCLLTSRLQWSEGVCPACVKRFRSGPAGLDGPSGSGSLL